MDDYKVRLPVETEIDRLKSAVGTLERQLASQQQLIDVLWQHVNDKQEGFKVNRKIDSFDERMDTMSNYYCTIIEQIERLNTQPVIGHHFPPLKEIAKIWVQVIHNEIKPKQRKCEWELWFEHFRGTVKSAAIKVKLKRKRELLKDVERVSSPYFHIVENMGDNVLGGFVRQKKLDGGGDFCPNQMAFMNGYRNQNPDEVFVKLALDSQFLDFNDFGLAAKPKTDGGWSPLWFAKWKRPANTTPE